MQKKRDFTSGAFLSDDLIQINRNINVRIWYLNTTYAPGATCEENTLLGY